MDLPERRRFDLLAVELSLALGTRVPRHALWLAASGQLADAARLATFCGDPLDAFLAGEKLGPIGGRARARLRRAVTRFDPARQTPHEVFGRLFGGVAGR